MSDLHRHWRRRCQYLGYIDFPEQQQKIHSKGSRSFLTQVPEVLGCILLAAISMQMFLFAFLFVMAIETLKHVGSKDNMSTIVEYWRRCAAATKAHHMAQYGSVWPSMARDVV